MSKIVSRLLLFYLLYACPFILKAQEPEFVNTVISILNAFNDKNAHQINSFTHDDIGIIILFKRGVFNEYLITHELDFHNPIPEYLPYSEISDYNNLKFEPFPEYDCDTDNWSKNGLFCDTINTDHFLSQTAYDLKVYREDNIIDSEIIRFKNIENNSRKVVCIDDKDNVIIFYLTLIKNKWFLTIIDRASFDCSA